MTAARRFWRILLLIVLAPLALRAGYVLLAKRHEPALGDQIYYVAQANTLARGDGFTDPRDRPQTAQHRPAPRRSPRSPSHRPRGWRSRSTASATPATTCCRCASP